MGDVLIDFGVLDVLAGVVGIEVGEFVDGGVGFFIESVFSGVVTLPAEGFHE